MSSQFPEIPLFETLEILLHKDEPLFLSNDTIYELIKYSIPNTSARPLNIVLTSGSVQDCIRNDMKQVLKTLLHSILKEWNIDECFFEDLSLYSFLSEIEKRMCEIAACRKFKKTIQLDLLESLQIQEHDIQNIRMFQSETESALNKISQKYHSGFNYLLKNLWIENLFVYQLPHDESLYMQQVLNDMKALISNNMNDLMGMLYQREMIPEFLRGRRMHRYIIGLLEQDKSFLTNLKSSNRMLKRAKKKIKMKEMPNMSLDIFRKQFYRKVQKQCQKMKAEFLTEKTMIRQLRYMRQILKQMNSMHISLMTEYGQFQCGPFEIRYNGRGQFHFGYHTGQYIMQDGDEPFSQYYLFDDAYVAVPLTKKDIKRGYLGSSIPPPVVVNSYGPHPFLQNPQTKNQVICLGDTAVSELVDKRHPLVDRVMNAILMGVKVMREGHHMKNKNSYYFKLSDPIFSTRRIDKKGLKTYAENSFISKYHKKPRGI
ncbi:hypothetical protein JW835_06930 [bacterium]|nr:hypothetical protein [bacterium]